MTVGMLALIPFFIGQAATGVDFSPLGAVPRPFMTGSPPLSTSINPWVGIALELIVLGLLMGGLRLYQRFGGLPAETSRKLFHIGGGLTTLTFPWVFAQPWPVIVLTAVTIPLLLSLKYVRVLKAGLGAVLYSVDRQSFGEVYFPLSVCLLFVLANGNALLYSIPILILALADTAAAVTGVRYGRTHYTAAGGEKSVEGSAMFFAVAFASVLVPLQLFSTTGRVEVLIIAVVLGLLVMMAEAIAWWGLDNLFIPLSAFLLLRMLLHMDPDALLVQLAVTGGLSITALLWRRHTTLNGGALIGAILGAYLIWTLGGWQWLLVPLALFMSYTALLPRTTLDAKRLINLMAIASVTSAGLFWLFLYRFTAHAELFYPFTIAFAAHLALIGTVRHKYAVPKVQAPRLLFSNIAKGWLVLAIAYLVFDGVGVAYVMHALLGLLGISLAAVAFYLTQPDLASFPRDAARWRLEAVCAGAGSLAGLVPLLALGLGLAP